MSGTLGFSNHSHFSRQPAYPVPTPPPISARVYSHQVVTPAFGKERLIPIQKAFRSLTQEPLFKQASFNATAASKDPQSVSWTMAKIGALLGVIYTTHVTTAEDREKIEALSREIDTLKATLKNRDDLTPKEQAYNEKCFSLANEAFGELNRLHRTLKNSYLVEKEWEEAIYPLTESVASPLFPGQSLLAGPSIKKGILAAAKLQKQIDNQPKDSAARSSLEKVRDELAARFLEEYQKWDQDVLQTIQKETQQLLTELENTQSPEKESERIEILQQLVSLRDQLQELGDTLRQFSPAKTKGMFPLQPLLQKTAYALQEEAKSLTEILDKQKGSALLEQLKYGKEAWLDLVAKRPVKDPSFLERMVNLLTFSPETWSDSKKALVENLLTGMQLSQYAIGVQAKMDQASMLRQRAEQMVQTVPKEAQEQIEKTVARLGTLLSDKYEDLQKNPKLIDTFSKGDPALRDALTQALGRFDQKPTREQLFQIMDAFKLSQYAAQQPSPFSHLSLGDWWSLFTKSEEVVEAESPVGPGAVVPSLLDNYAVAVSPATRSLPWVSRVIGAVGKMLSFTQEVEQAPTLSAFVSAKAVQGEQQLNLALANLTQQQVQVAQDSQQITQELSREIALLQREVLKTLQNKPEDICPLSTLAIWEQEVSDKCYAVEQLEERVASLMSKARSSLSSNDAELEKFGKKHKNIVKQARLIEGLKLPGLSVPIPHGITTDKARAFLEEYAPVVFSEWNTLGKEYAAYEGSTPFFDEPTSKSRLQKIEQGIKEAFRQAGEDPVLFQKLASPELIAWLDGVKGNNDYLMVRSTGAEDSRETANAGGNKSPAYVSPTPQAFCEAAGEVIISYFGFGSLQNRVNAGLNPFKLELKLAVTAQPLIGEPIGGTPYPKSIPISLVLFTSEPLYIGNEKFRTMRISATYGHGEGVVGGLGIGTDTALILVSDAHPDRLYILYENADKPVRLAPVRTAKGVELQPVDNPSFMQKQPALTDELIARLYTWGVVGEKFFDDYPTDMEIVVKNGIIYPVQARPINRPDLLPTYVDRKRVASLNAPILDEIQGDLLVPGRGSAVIITDPQQVNFAKTLKDAEDASHKKKYDIVMVAKPEPANSHPVVNFSGLGMPCLVVKEEEHLQQLISQASPEHPLVIDMQTGKVMLWDQSKGDVNDCIVKGFAVHPAKIAISLPVASKAQPKTRSEVPQEVKDLVLAIGVAATKQAAKESLQLLRQHPFVSSLKEQRAFLSQHRATVRKVKETQEILSALDQRIDLAFEEVETSLQNAPEEAPLRPLLHVKILGSLLTETGGSGLAQFSRLTVQPLYEEALTLIDYQKSLPHPAHFADLVSIGSEALLPETQKAWVDFLKSLEPLAESGKITKQQLGQFHKMLENLEKTQELPTWLTFTFSRIDAESQKIALQEREQFQSILENRAPVPLTSPVDEESTLDKFHELLNALSTKEESFLNHFLSLNQALSASQKQIDLFSSPETFKKGWKWLQSQVEQVKSQTQLGPEGSLAEQLRSSSPMGRTLALKVMAQLVDTFDLSIKAMKSSSQWPREDKPKVFKQMLGPYLDMLLDWTNVLDTAGITTHESWPIPAYLTKLKELFAEMPDNEDAHLDPSMQFSVAAAMLGSNTEFSRHYPVHLEDFFTLCHQNLLALLNHNNNQLYPSNSIQEASLPPLLKHMLTHVDQNFGRRIERSNLAVSETGVVTDYNIPLRNHAAKMKIEYNKETGEITLKGFLLGPARSRWGLSRTILLMLEHLGLPLSEPVHMAEQEMHFSWKINDAKTFEAAKREWLFLLEMSLDEQLERYPFDRLISRQSLSPKAIAEKVLSDLNERHIPPGVSELRLYNVLIAKYAQGVQEAIAALLLTEEKPSQEVDRISLDLIRDARLELIKTIVSKGEGFDLAITLAAEGMKIPSIQMQREWVSLTKTVVSNMGTDAAIERSKEWIESADPKDHLKSIRLMSAVVTFNKGAEEAIAIAQRGFESTDPHTRIRSLILLRLTVESGYGFEEAIAIVKKGIKDSNADVKKTSINLMTALVLKEEAIDLTLNVVDDLKTSPTTSSIELMIRLVEKGKGFNTALDTVRQGMTHPAPSIYEGSLIRLINSLMDQKQGFNEIIEIAGDGFRNPDATIRKQSLEFMKELMSKEKGFDEAIDLAEKGIRDENTQVRLTALELAEKLIDKNQNVQRAIAIIRQGVQDTDRGEVRWKSLMLTLKLTEKKRLISEAIEIANEGFQDVEKDNRLLSIKIMATIDKSGSIEAILSLASKGCLDISDEVRRESRALMTNMIDYEQGVAVAIATAQQGFLLSDQDNILNQNIRSDSLYLMKRVVQYKKKGLAEATAMAQKGVTDPSPEVQRISIGLMDSVVSYEYGLKEALEIANIGVRNQNNGVFRAEILSLMESLVSKGMGFQDATAMVEQGSRDTRPSIKTKSLELLLSLVKKGQALEIATEMISQTVAQKVWLTDVIYMILDALLEHGKGFDLIISMIKQGITDPNYVLYEDNIRLVDTLMKHNQGFDEIIEIAGNGFKNTDPAIREESLKLMKELISREKGFDIALEMAEKAIRDKNDLVNFAAFELIEELISKKESFQGVIAIIRQGIQAKEPAVRWEILLLTNILVGKGYIPSEAIEIAKQGFLDVDNMNRLKSVKIMASLEKSNHAEAILSFAGQGCLDTNDDVRSESLLLMAGMIDYEQGVARAIATAQQGFLLNDRSNSENIRADSLFLMNQVVEQKKEGLEEATAMAEKGITDSSPKIQENSIILMNSVVSCNYGFKEALAVAQTGMRSLNNQPVCIISLNLMEKLVERGLYFDEAVELGNQALASSDEPLQKAGKNLLQMVEDQS